MFLISEVFLQTAYPGTVLRKVFKTFYWKEFEQATRQPVRSTGHNFFLTIWSLFNEIAKQKQNLHLTVLSNLLTVSEADAVWNSG